MKSAGKLAGPLKLAMAQVKEFAKMALWITSIALVGVALRSYVQSSAEVSAPQSASTTSLD